MKLHVPWSPTLQDVLTEIGANHGRMTQIREYQAQRCLQLPKPPGLYLSRGAETALFLLGATPQDIRDIKLHCAALDEWKESEKEPTSVKEKDAARKRAERAAAGDIYRMQDAKRKRDARKVRKQAKILAKQADE